MIKIFFNLEFILQNLCKKGYLFSNISYVSRTLKEFSTNFQDHYIMIPNCIGVFELTRDQIYFLFHIYFKKTSLLNRMSV